MNARILYRPAIFFLIAYCITWAMWAGAAWFSYRGGMEGPEGLLVFLGLCGPFVATLIMFHRAKCPGLWDDYRDRLLSIRRINLRTLPVILFLIPAVMGAAIGISLLFGKSADQFAILLGSSFATLPALIGLFLAPALEEAGWRGYGMDSLRHGRTLFTASLWFALLWAGWHIPLFFINNYYHRGLLSNGLYTVNFFVTVVATAFIVSWLYYRNNRSIIACILFHLSANISMSFIPAEPETKCIVTVLLIVIIVIIVLADRKFWFDEKWPGPQG
ncbi:MAG TPA: CPBP family intramembrane glutamic endopeptidase [Methanoregula sp.]|nr:CPBP family intramembrane glutamic endopeptidase [Methanoregula sp.]